MSISEDEVRKIAGLARLELTESEMSSLTGDLDRIIEYVKKVGRLAGPSGGSPGDDIGRGTPLREDVERVSLPVEEALRPAPDHDESFFRVPPVIEREDGA